MQGIQLSVSNLRKRYAHKLVLNGITFRVGGGDCVAVVGPNGAGKTTLLKCLCGLLKPNDGDVLLFIGEKALQPNEARPFIGALFDDCEPYGELTVRENLEFILSLKRCYERCIVDTNRGSNSKLGHSQIEQLLDEFQLSRCANELAGSLSSGMKQRLKLAMACAGEPLLLLLDEPMANLDNAGKAAVMRAVRIRRGKGSIVVWAACDAGEIEDATILIKLGEAKHGIACKGFED